jgi:hypothetical protein
MGCGNRTHKDETRASERAMLRGPADLTPSNPLVAATPWESLGWARTTHNCCKASSLAPARIAGSRSTRALRRR